MIGAHRRHGAVAFIALAASACAASDLTGPEGLVRPGLYVLASLDGSGPPFITRKATGAEGSGTYSQIAFDSVFVDSDSTFHRSLKLEMYYHFPSGPPQIQQSDQRWVAGAILRRGDEVVMASIPTPSDVGRTAYFEPRHNALRARVRKLEYVCNAMGECTVIFDHYVDAIYTRR